MTAKPEKDVGQKLDSPEGRMIGFIDSQSQVQALSKSLNEAGYPESQITVLQGDDGLRILERTGNASSWGEDEARLFDDSVDQLQRGHFRIEIEVANRDEAVHLAEIAARLGLHTIGYYGTVISQLIMK